MQLIMCKGLPASGKSTWASIEVLKSSGLTVRVNKDDLREMIHGGKWSGKNEQVIIWARDSLVITALNTGHNVIVDDTNLHPKHEKALREIAESLGAEFIIQDFTYISLNECIRRDSEREKAVGRKAILQMYNQYLRKEYKPPKDKPFCVICDLDGTLAKFQGNPYSRDFSKDTPNEAVKYILQLIELRNDSGIYQLVNIIFLSGRSDEFEDVTRKWIEDTFDGQDFVYELHMRKEEDKRKDHIVKKELFDNYIRDSYQVLFVMDDRNQVVDLWRSEGLTCFQVDYGDF